MTKVRLENIKYIHEWKIKYIYIIPFINGYNLLTQLTLRIEFSIKPSIMSWFTVHSQQLSYDIYILKKLYKNHKDVEIIEITM